MMFTLLFAMSACSSPPAEAPITPIPPVTPIASPPPTAEAPAAPHAGGEHAHAAPHGGMVQTVGDIHVEALMLPAGVMFYLSDGAQTPMAVEGYSGNAVIKSASGVTTVELMALGDHLHAGTTLVQGQPATVVLTLRHSGKAVSASFEAATVGLESHDHTTLHGGQVSMWGDMHVEYAPKDGSYRAWLTDEHRNAVTGPISGSIKDGDATIPMVADGLGMLSAKGAGAGSRPVTVSVTVGETSFSLGFNATE